MITITFPLDDEAQERLKRIAQDERRTVEGQAEIFVLEALGLRPKSVVKLAPARSRPGKPSGNGQVNRAVGDGQPRTG